MIGIWNNKTKRYETSTGKHIQQPNINGLSFDEQEELREIEKIQAEGGTYLERYAKELGVEEVDLLKDILANNSMARFNSVKTYENFKMLKQTLVEEKGTMGRIKQWNNIIDGAYRGGTR